MNEFPEEHVKVSSLEFVHFAHCQKLLACQRSLKRKIEQPWGKGKLLAAKGQ